MFLFTKKFIVSFMFLLGAIMLSNSIYAADSVNTKASQTLFELINQIKSMKADFTQTLINKNQNIKQVSNGEMWISKPSNFKWETLSPNKQLLISNGNKLWNYDEDLEQVTVQPVPNDISTAPYLLLLTGTESALSKLFNVQQISEGKFRLTPKLADQSMLSHVDMVFDDDILQSLTIQTEVGQKSTIIFSNQKMVDIPQRAFEFIPPKGVDVLG